MLLDLAVQSHQVLSQRDIYALSEDARARINTVYMTSAFVGGSVASGLSGWLHDVYGWTGVTVFGAILPVLAGGIWIYDRLRPPARPEPAAVAAPVPSAADAVAGPAPDSTGAAEPAGQARGGPVRGPGSGRRPGTPVRLASGRRAGVRRAGVRGAGG